MSVLHAELVRLRRRGRALSGLFRVRLLRGLLQRQEQVGRVLARVRRQVRQALHLRQAADAAVLGEAEVVVYDVPRVVGLQVSEKALGMLGQWAVGSPGMQRRLARPVLLNTPPENRDTAGALTASTPMQVRRKSISLEACSEGCGCAHRRAGCARGSRPACGCAQRGQSAPPRRTPPGARGSRTARPPASETCTPAWAKKRFTSF